MSTRAPDQRLLVHAVDRLDRTHTLLDAIHELALSMATESGEDYGSPIAEIALTAMRRMDKVRRDIEKYRHAL